MLDKNTLVKLTNRTNGSLSYDVEDLGIRRNFMKDETKEVPMEEIVKLNYSPGGAYMLRECLLIDNEDAIKEVLGQVEPEYYYSRDTVKELLISGTLEQLMDCLDFCPSGVKDMIREEAIEMELPDMRKREIIYEKTGFNITNAIQINRESEEQNAEESTERRSEPLVKEMKTPPKYKVVSQ